MIACIIYVYLITYCKKKERRDNGCSKMLFGDSDSQVNILTRIKLNISGTFEKLKCLEYLFTKTFALCIDCYLFRVFCKRKD